MSDEDLLQTIAEIAVALAGFTGVVAFLGQRARGEWRRVDLFRLNQLLSGSLAAALLAFVPMVAFRLGTDEIAAWRIGSLATALYICTASVWASLRLRSIPDLEREEIVPIVLYAVQATAASIAAMQIMNVAGLVWSGEAGPVITGLVWLLTFSGFQFVRLLRMLSLADDPST